MSKRHWKKTRRETDKMLQLLINLLGVAWLSTTHSHCSFLPLSSLSHSHWNVHVVRVMLLMQLHVSNISQQQQQQQRIDALALLFVYVRCVCVCLFGCLIFSAFPTSSSSHTPDSKMANSVLCTKFNTINFLSDMYRGWWCGTHTKEEFVTRSMTTAYGHKLLPALFFLLFAKCIARQVIS